MVFVLKFPFLLLFFKFIQYNFKLQSSLFLHHHVREKPWARLEQIVPQPLNFSFSCTEHLYPGNFFFSSFEGIPCDRGYTTKVNFPLSSLDNNFLVIVIAHSQLHEIWWKPVLCDIRKIKRTSLLSTQSLVRSSHPWIIDNCFQSLFDIHQNPCG